MTSYLANAAILISGRGSNLEQLIKQADFYQAGAVVSDNAAAGGVQIAKSMGVPTYIFERSDFGSKNAYFSKISGQLRELGIDLVALAGFMQIVPKGFLDNFPNRVVNIHPSLLPAFPGLETHRRVLNSKESVHGCTVHFVDSGIDTGPVIAQAQCKVELHDDEATLAARVLELEHKLYPWCLNNIAAGEIALLSDGNVLITAQARAEGEGLGFLLKT